MVVKGSGTLEAGGPEGRRTPRGTEWRRAHGELPAGSPGRGTGAAPRCGVPLWAPRGAGPKAAASLGPHLPPGRWGKRRAQGPGGGLRGTGCGQRRADHFGAALGHSNHRRDTRPETRPLTGVKCGFFCSNELIKGKWRLPGFAVLLIFAFKHAAGAIYQLYFHEE